MDYLEFLSSYVDVFIEILTRIIDAVRAFFRKEGA